MLGSPVIREKYKSINEVPEKEKRIYVESYHIDSELGLYIFVKILKAEEFLSPCSETPGGLH
jgi:hypothetical protein